MRGNPPAGRGHPVLAGSIPARAGEPQKGRRRARTDQVYPRACGGTQTSRVTSLLTWGLSPRVRGNRARSSSAASGPGSIPARAGEPGPPLRCGGRTKVYPRACGGTELTPDATPLAQGLSPRVRGNRFVQRLVDPQVRSIPARAGEPHPPARPRTSGRVYPRACGGTCRRPRRSDSPPGLSPRVRGNLLGAAERRRLRGSIPARAGEPLPVHPRRPG